MLLNLQKPTSGVTSLQKQHCRQSDPLMWFISQYYWLYHEAGCPPTKQGLNLHTWIYSVKLHMCRQIKPRFVYNFKQDLIKRLNGVTCRASTWHLTTRGELELDIGHSNKRIVSTDPWGDQFALLWFQAFQRGWIEDKRAGHISRRLGNVALMGCKDKQITGMRCGFVIVTSLWFTPRSITILLIKDN